MYVLGLASALQAAVPSEPHPFMHRSLGLIGFRVWGFGFRVVGEADLHIRAGEGGALKCGVRQ